MKCILLILPFSFLLSCKFYRIDNKTDQYKKITIAYKNCSNCYKKIDEFQYLEKKGFITNVKQSYNDRSFVFSFDLNPQKFLLLTRILQLQNSERGSKEEKFICIHNNESLDKVKCDTILHRLGNKELHNKFASKSKILLLTGRQIKIYTLND